MESSIEPEDTDRLFDDSPEPEQQPDNSFFGLIIYNISVYFQNPWILLALAGLAYYVYQNYLSNIRLPTRTRDDQVTPQDEEKVRYYLCEPNYLPYTYFLCIYQLIAVRILY